MIDHDPSAGHVHRPVLLDEVVEALGPRPGSTIVDGTLGAGGHAAALAARVAPGGRVLGLDRDPSMIALAEAATRGLAVEPVHAGYDELPAILDGGLVDGIVLDLGLSSDQLGWSHRGFSFAADGPLDMRFDPTRGDSAADLVNELSEAELADVFYQYGEERHSRRVARNIVEARRSAPVATTGELAAIIRRSIPGKWGPIDPSTRVFQALRIAVNGELDRLDEALRRLPDCLRPGARLAIISFHSLEDRRVKHAFRADPRLAVLTKKVVVASPEEVQRNPRARSAKLRVAERCTNTTTPPPTIRGRPTAIDPT